MTVGKLKALLSSYNDHYEVRVGYTNNPGTIQRAMERDEAHIAAVDFLDVDDLARVVLGVQDRKAPGM